MAKQGEATLLLKIKQAGEEVLDRLVVTLSDVGKMAEFVASKAYELGKALVEMVFEGSKIEQINKQFEFLAKQAGVTASVLKDELVGATDGLADDTDVILAANKALVTLEGNAAQFPELMRVATNASRLMGISVVDAFETITSSIAAGNARGLRHLGIVIDQEAAFKKMAGTLGLSASELNKFQQQQAILNGVLEKAGGALAEAGKSADGVGEAYTRLKVAGAQLYESTAKGANETFGGWFKSMFNSAAKTITNMANSIGMEFGTESEKAASKAGVLRNQIEHLTEVNKKYYQDHGKDSEYIVKKIAAIQAEITGIEKKAAGERVATTKQENKDKQDAAVLDATQLLAIQSRRQEMMLAKETEAAAIATAQRRYNMLSEFAEEDERRVMLEQQQLQTLEAEAAVAALRYNQAKTDAEKLIALKAKTAADEKVIKQRQALDEATIEKERNDKLKSERGSYLAFISNLQNSSNKELAALGKAAAIAQITISTAEAASHGYKWGMAIGGPAGPAVAASFAALAYAAGAAQIAKVAGVQLAEGGIVMPTPGGTQATIGEAGQAEAVIPLDKAGDMGFGGGITINVNGGLLGDQNQAREFALAIDRQLLELRRNNESVSFDGRVV